MDNFEYSIQINDRDWAEFYSTAEECGLMQASLAKEEELWLSDTEHEDTSNCMPSNKRKFIRVSLCPPPPPPPEEYPALQISQTVVSQSVQTSNRCLEVNEDLLSGSEDEEEFASVTRFLCHKESMKQKKESEQRIDIPHPKPACHDKITNPPNEHSRISSVREGIAEYMRTLNLDRNVNYIVAPWQNMGKTTMDKSTNTEEELGHSGTEPTVPIQPSGDPRPNDNILYPNNLSYCVSNNDSCSSANGHLQNENIPGVNTSGEEEIGKMGHSRRQAPLSPSLSKDNCFNTEHGMFEGPTHPKELPSSKDNGLVYYTMENETCEVATKANVNSSAVEQNVPTPTIEELHSSPTPTIEELHSCPTPPIEELHSCPTPPIEELHSSPTPPIEELHSYPTPTIEELHSCPTATIEELHSCIALPDSLNFVVKVSPNTLNSVDGTTSTHSLVPVNITTRAWRNKTPLSPPCSASDMKPVLTLPEMYDFFFADVSDSVFLETESNMECKEGIVYTPEMYEYFFLEDEEENRANSKGGNTSQESSTDLALASTSSAVATWPEACEFFFADGPQDQEREGVMFSVPPSQVQIAADIMQSFVPKGLKGVKLRRAHPRRGPDGSFPSQEHPGASEESNISGAIAPYLSPSRSDACLVFLAFASWAVKSSDLTSSDGWKTALLANIGAVSAIQYLRRRSRRTWQDSPPHTGDET